jgi:hypothetical protein
VGGRDPVLSLQIVAQRTKVAAIQRTEAKREFQQELTEQAEYDFGDFASALSEA